MATAGGRPKLRKSMRVATIFTGVAATVGVTQAADAQAAPSTTVKPASRHTGQVVRPAGHRISGSIQYYESCASGVRHAVVHPTWLHVSTAHSGGYGLIGVSVCFGFKGIYSSPPGTGMQAECGGNNYGYIDGTNKGRTVSIHFGPGTTYRNVTWSHYDDVLITSWKGNDTCGRAPHWGDPNP